MSYRISSGGFVFCVFLAVVSSANGQTTYAFTPVMGTSDIRGISPSGTYMIGSSRSLQGSYTLQLLENGTIVNSFQYNGLSTTGSDINDRGVLVGFYDNASGGQSSFETTVANLKNGVPPTPIIVPGADSVGAAGINNAGSIVGSAIYSGDNQGFVQPDPTGQGSVEIKYPGAHVTSPYKINDTPGLQPPGTIVGFYQTSQPTQNHAFVLVNGVYTTFDFPGAKDTVYTGINELDDISGDYTDSGSQEHGLLDSLSLDYPGASNTEVLGVSDSGEIVGVFETPSGLQEGFYAIPVPEPAASLSLLTMASVGFLGRRQRFPAASVTLASRLYNPRNLPQVQHHMDANHTVRKILDLGHSGIRRNRLADALAKPRNLPCGIGNGLAVAKRQRHDSFP
jgi:hypothetical protein